MRKALTGIATVAFVAGVALLAVSLSQSPSALAQETENEVFFQPLDDVLEELVDEEVITEEQRNRIAEAFREKMVRFGKGLRGIPHLEIVAGVLDMEVDELAERIRNGATIAEVAGPERVQAVIDALVAERSSRLDEAVAEGKLTEETAQELRALLAERVEAMVYGERLLVPFGCREHFDGPRRFDRFQFFNGPNRFHGFGSRSGFGLGDVVDAVSRDSTRA